MDDGHGEVSRFAGNSSTAPASLWEATAHPAPALPVATGVIDTDVAIVGAGFTGLTTALELAAGGVQPVVLEAAEPGWGGSGRNGGQVIPGLKLDPDEILTRFGPEIGPRLIAFAGSAPDAVFSNIERYGIDCQAVRAGWIQPAHNDATLKLVADRCAQWRRHGADVEMLSSADVARLIGTNIYCGGWLDRRAGAIHPLNYARGLARAALERGVALHGNSPVVDITRRGAQWELETPAAKVRAKRVLLCTNAYSGELAGGLKRTFIAPNSFQIATKPLSPEVRRSILGEGHVASDARRLLLYYRLDPAGRLLLGGRGTFRDPVDAEAFSHLERGMKAMFPQAAAAEIEFRWSGRVSITLDHLPHLHDLTDGLYAVTGYNGRGVALTSAVGKALGQWLLDPTNALPIPLSKPGHIPMHRLQELYVAAGSAWYRFRDWMT